MKVVITRARDQASELAVLLRAAGMEPLELPLIEMQPPEDWGPVDAAVANIESYDWVLFTSANAVRFLDPRLPAGFAFAKGVCCIGPKTREVAERSGHWNVTLVPKEYVAESVVEAFAEHSLEGARIFLPRAAVARDLVPAALRERGATVDIVEVYRNVIPADAAENAARIFAQKPDWIAFTSSSTVKNLLAVTDRSVLDGIRIASIGPVTSEIARKHGLQVDAEAVPHTLEGLVQAIRNHE